MLFWTKRKKIAKEPPRTTVQRIGAYTFAIPEASPTPPVRSRASSEHPRSSFLYRIYFFVQSFHRQCLRFIWKPLFLTIFACYWTIVCAVTRLLHKPWYDLFLAHNLPRVFAFLDQRLANQRQLLLQHVKGRVLDVGAGSGEYMKRLMCKSTVSHLVVLEPHDGLRASLHAILSNSSSSNTSSSNKSKHRISGERVLQNFQITIVADTVESYAAAYQHKLPTPSPLISSPPPPPLFDWIILGNVLCEVPDVTSALASMNAMLKPGGYVYFSEHIASPRGSWARWKQGIAAPWWRLISGGCNCCRDTLEHIQGMADWDLVSWKFDNLGVLGGPMIMGICQKVAITA